MRGESYRERSANSLAWQKGRQAKRVKGCQAGWKVEACEADCQPERRCFWCCQACQLPGARPGLAGFPGVDRQRRDADEPPEVLCRKAEAGALGPHASRGEPHPFDLLRHGRACDPALLLLLQEGHSPGQGGHLTLEGCEVALMLGRGRVFRVWALISRRAARRILSFKRLRRLGIFSVLLRASGPPGPWSAWAPMTPEKPGSGKHLPEKQVSLFPGRCAQSGADKGRKCL